MWMSVAMWAPPARTTTEADCFNNFTNCTLDAYWQYRVDGNEDALRNRLANCLTTLEECRMAVGWRMFWELIDGISF